MNNKTTPNWQPIEFLSILTHMVKEQLNESEEQYNNLLQAVDKPHVLDDYTINKTIQVYKEQLHYIDVFYKKQFEKWEKEEKLTLQQQNQINQAYNDIENWRKYVVNILEMADKIKDNTIEKVMSKSDIELALEALEKMTKKDNFY